MAVSGETQTLLWLIVVATVSYAWGVYVGRRTG